MPLDSILRFVEGEGKKRADEAHQKERQSMLNTAAVALRAKHFSSMPQPGQSPAGEPPQVQPMATGLPPAVKQEPQQTSLLAPEDLLEIAKAHNNEGIRLLQEQAKLSPPTMKHRQIAAGHILLAMALAGLDPTHTAGTHFLEGLRGGYDRMSNEDYQNAVNQYSSKLGNLQAQQHGEFAQATQAQKEADALRSSLDREDATNMMNFYRENQIGLAQGRAEEAARHNQATEAVTGERVGETNRHNLVTEGTATKKLSIEEQKAADSHEKWVAERPLYKERLALLKTRGELTKAQMHHLNQIIQYYPEQMRRSLEKAAASIANLNSLRSKREASARGGKGSLTANQVIAQSKAAFDEARKDLNDAKTVLANPMSDPEVRKQAQDTLSVLQKKFSDAKADYENTRKGIVGPINPMGLGIEKKKK